MNYWQKNGNNNLLFFFGQTLLQIVVNFYQLFKQRIQFVAVNVEHDDDWKEQNLIKYWYKSCHIWKTFTVNFRGNLILTSFC